ncbi:MAG: hypothetical protein ACREBE_29010, partial [bacterium]
RDAFAVIDGAIGPGFGDIAQLTVARRGGRAAYLGTTGGAAHVVVDGAVGAAVQGTVRALQVGPDGSHVAFLVSDPAAGDRVTCDGAELAAASPRTLAAASLAIVAAPACAVVYVVEGTGMQVVRAGVAEPRFDEVGTLAVSSDGRHVGYAARRGAAWSVVIDGREHDGGHWAEAPVWSPDGARTGYLARRGDHAVAVVDGRDYRFDVALDGTLAFSRDGRTWSIVAGDLARQELYFAIDGTRRVPLPADELYSAAAALSLAHPLLDPATPNVLGLWSAAEADRAR